MNWVTLQETALPLWFYDSIEKKNVYVLDQLCFSPDVLAARESWKAKKQHLSIKNNGIEVWGEEEGIQWMKSEPLNSWGACPPACCSIVSTHSNSCFSFPTRLHNMDLSWGKTAAVAQPENNTASVLRAQFLGALITSKIASPNSQNIPPREGGGLYCYRLYFAYSKNKASWG